MTINKKSVYADDSIILTTQHGKSLAIAPIFSKILSAKVIECTIDTDLLGTFSGEVERKGTQLACAQKKCELGIEATNSDYGLSSEGSFGPHPYIPFIPCNYEILYFIDRKRNFNLHVSKLTEKTNFNIQVIDSFKELKKIAQKAAFPSHALILSPDNNQNKEYIWKGIQTDDMLKTAFYNAKKHSSIGKVLVQTDMRAHMNPSRMNIIQELAKELADRLATLCMKCQTPGWGKIGIEKGLECHWCAQPTELIKMEIYGCITCNYTEKINPSHSKSKADPQDCSHCNP